MEILYYKANTVAEAFELASKDTKTWNFPEMDALAQMARDLRAGYVPTQSGIAKDCFCNSAFFKLFDDEPAKGYGIALVLLKGHESGIADSGAQEILDFHRDHPNEELYADQLLVWSKNITSLEELDHGYELLVQGMLIEKTDTAVTLMEEDGTEHQRSAYCTRRNSRPDLER